MKKLILFFTAVAMLTLSCEKNEHKSIVTFEKNDVKMELKAKERFYILDGNGGYSWTFSEEGIADVIEVKNGTIRIEAKSVGETRLTLTDCKETADTMHITVFDPSTLTDPSTENNE